MDGPVGAPAAEAVPPRRHAVATQRGQPRTQPWERLSEQHSAHLWAALRALLSVVGPCARRPGQAGGGVSAASWSDATTPLPFL
jgi:hypothetical protein